MPDILLVDNDARLAELMAWFLRKRGHTVRIALSYADARERIAEREPELMLADLELGRERGRDELPRMAREHRLPRTIVVSGYLDRETEAELADVARVSGMLRKPFGLDALERAIDACLLASHANDGAHPGEAELRAREAAPGALRAREMAPGANPVAPPARSSAPA
jgi:DNA-binding response OmpR family regulator